MNDVQFWDEAEKRLGVAFDKKVREIINLELIDKAAPGAEHHYEVRPIPGYNSTTYRMTLLADGTYSCSCQGYAFRQRCAHQTALKVYHFKNAEKITGSLF